MKFVLSDGEQMREKLQEFPRGKLMTLSKVLVVAMNNSDIVAACGVRGMFNILSLNVKEGYRGRGIGTQILEKTIIAARKRNLGFITLTVFSNNIPALHLYSKYGFKEVAYVKKFRFKIMMLPLSFKAKPLCTLLHRICSKLPDTFLVHASGWAHDLTIWEK